MRSRDLPRKLDIEITEGEDIEKRYKLFRMEFGPEKVIRIFDPDMNHTWGYVVVDNLARGPSLGGVRLAQNITVQEVYGLARAMTFKNAASMLPIGGGKSGIIEDPLYYMENRLEKKRLIMLFAEALWLVKEYIPGPDMGTNEDDMQTIYDVYTRLNRAPNHGRGGVGRSPEKGGLPLDEWGLTAHGLFAAAKTAEEYESGFCIKGAKVIIQGYGNVGCPTAEKLCAAGAMIIGASDINAGLYNPTGLDMEELNRVKKKKLGLMQYRGKTDLKLVREKLDDLLNIPCDILIPAARPDAITWRNRDNVQARIILEGANNPVDWETEYYLSKNKGITCMTDFIVNAGGVISCAVELKMDVDEEYRKKMLKEDGLGKAYMERLIYKTISMNVKEIYCRLKARKNDNLIWRDVAMDLAKERLGHGACRSRDLSILEELR